ncbi:hypothetical protein [Absidia glauca]|uniref:Rho-GAP domain-containing protein n=1 Tax=Absidia glauca TaxID=4829 RepID=A0A168KRC4_ABSGL|nr:hypothetical protein [Absidia glauca]
MMMPPTIEKLPPITPSLLESIRTTTSRLPPIHLELLEVLCQHLKRIAGNADENKMSTSNLALIFIPTLGMGRLLFHCMVDHYDQVFNSSSSSSAGPTRTHTRSSSASTVAPFNKPLPPPLPHKPKHINITTANSSSSPWRQNKSFDLERHRTEHTKTLSDTDIKSMITPPPKPPRSPVSKLVNDYFKPGQTKARSKSVSSSSNHQIDLISPVPIRVTTPPTISPSPSSISSSSTIALRSRSGSRVEAIGRQFEQLGKKSSGFPSSSSNKAL